MHGLPSIAVEFFAVAVLLLAFGYLVRFRGWTFLLAGYDDTSAVPDEVAANVAGNTFLRIGTAALIVGALFALADPPVVLSGFFAAAVVLDVARLLYRLNTYSPDAADTAG